MIKKKSVLPLYLALLLLEAASLFLYYGIKKEDPRFLRTGSFASTMAGSSDSFYTLSPDDPVFIQPFLNQYADLERFFLFFYHCDQARSGILKVKLSDTEGNLYYEYSFEPQYLKQDTFCLMAECNLELSPATAYQITVTAEDLSPGDTIAVGTTSTPSKPAVFPETQQGTLFTTLFYSYQDSSALLFCLRTLTLLLAGLDLVLLFLILLLVYQKPKAALGLFACCVLTVLAVLLTNTISEKRKWHSRYPYISHAMGIIEDHDYSNCLEAFQSAYQKGHRVFEVDFAMTSDGHIVLKHDWEKDSGLPEFENGYIPTLKEFKSARIWGKYTTLDIYDLLSLMLEYPDIYVVTDSKSGQYDQAVTQFTQISRILDTYPEKDRRHILSHLVVQIYNNDMYEGIRNLLPIENYIYTLYQRGIGNLEELTDFCTANHIEVVTLPYGWLTPEELSLFHQNHLKVYVHTLNKAEDIQSFWELGVDGIYTDSYPAK